MYSECKMYTLYMSGLKWKLCYKKSRVLASARMPPLNSMRWPLISLVGQAPVCQALEKFRGNLCHLDARERSFCTPRMYICLLRAILPWYPCLHSRLNFMYNWIGFYIYIAEEHLQYRIVCVQSCAVIEECSRTLHYRHDVFSLHR